MTRSSIKNSSQEQVDVSKIITQKRGNKISNKNTSAYMADPDVQEFNKAMQKRIFTNSNGGRPYAFESIEKLQEQVNGFFDLCNSTNTIPTIVNLALYLGVHRDTIYAHANDVNSPYSDIFKNLITYFHSIMENGALVGKINPVTYIFLGKNYFNLSDSKDINIKPGDGSSSVNSTETMTAIQKQLEAETIQEAKISAE